MEQDHNITQVTEMVEVVCKEHSYAAPVTSQPEPSPISAQSPPSPPTCEHPAPTPTLYGDMTVQPRCPTMDSVILQSDASSTPKKKKSTKKKEIMTPRKLKMQRTINRLRTQVCRLKKKLKHPGTVRSKKHQVDQCLDAIRGKVKNSTYELLKHQVKVAEKSRHGVRWTIPDKKLCLKLFYQSRKSYKILQKVLHLPSVRTLQRAMQGTCIYPGFNKKFLDALEAKVSVMEAKDRVCSLVFDEMAIKENVIYNKAKDVVDGFEDFGDNSSRSEFIANEALVFMVRGLNNKWKQPICYFLSSGPTSAEILASLIDKCVNTMSDVGLIVKLVVCDQGSNNRAALTSKGVTPDKPYFMHRDEKIYCFFDPPHLLKNIRNNLKKGNFQRDSVRWEYVVKAFQADKENNRRTLPKVSKRHIDLPMFSSLRVDLAAQILSHSMASALRTCISLKELPQEAKKTALFVDNFDKLFDCFNARRLYTAKKYDSAFSNSSVHIQFLKDAISYLKGLLHNQKKLPCLEGWIQNIEALFLLWPELQANYKFEQLFTSRLNQDCCENLFAIIRSRGGNRDNPDNMQFRAAFRHLCVDRLFITSDYTNCKDDDDDILLNLMSLKTAPSFRKAPAVEERPQLASTDFANSDHFTQKFTTLENNAAVYIGGYLLKKCNITHSACSNCKNSFVLDDIPSVENYTYLREKLYMEDSKLVVPSSLFMTFVNAVECTFLKCFPNVIYKTDVLYNLYQSCLHHVKSLNMPCLTNECSGTISNVLVLYLKVRLYYELKNATVVKGTRGKKVRKLLKLQHI